MNITILNGNPLPSSFDAYLNQLASILHSEGHTITQLDLRDMSLRYCIGCWGCWVKTPSECTNHDASLEMDRAVIQADYVLWAAPLKMGFPSELLKRAVDKHVPLIHPYMEVAYGEAHHLKRYPRYPRIGLLLEKEASSDEKDLKIVSDIFCRTAINLKTRLEFVVTTEVTPAKLASRIAAPSVGEMLPLPNRLSATQGSAIPPPKSVALFNGSPRGSKGNTPIFLREIAHGFGGSSETYHLVRIQDTDNMVQAFGDAECAILGFPLYTDSMPGVVKHFIEALEPLVGRKNNPAIGFVIQSGFPEALHSRYVERYLQKLAQRLDCAYLGAVVKGGGEATRLVPERANRRLFANLRVIGAGLAEKGSFDPSVLAAIARPERFPAILGPVFRVFLRTPIAHMYFDNMLKENNAYERRFARPFSG